MINKVKLNFEEVGSIFVDEGIKIKEALEKLNYNKIVYAVIINNRLHSLEHRVESDSDVRLITYTTNQGQKMYEATLKFLLYCALNNLYPSLNFKCSNKMGRDVLIKIDTAFINIESIKDEIRRLIALNIPIKSKRVRRERLDEIYKNQGYNCSLDVNNPFDDDYKVNYIEFDDKVYYNYLYERLLPCTSMIKEFNIKENRMGIILMMPTALDENILEENVQNSKCLKLFEDKSLLGIDYISDLNEKIINSEGEEIIRKAELIQSIRFDKLVSEILDRNANLIFIAGPSSSGKTTSAIKIEERLKIAGKSICRLCMDDFFKDYIDSPLDEKGNKNFDSINHMDIDCFKKCIEKLKNGEEVVLPRYDFSLNLGQKVYDSSPTKISEDTIFIIEGIHGLNPIFTDMFLEFNIFRIYISPMVTLNYDNFTKVSSNLSRLTRRIVRDYLNRGCDIDRTFELWEKVKQGEIKNIWPYIKEADYILNTSLVYEHAVLRPYAEKILKTVKISSKWYYLAKMMYQMLQRFESLDSKCIPKDSLIREFIGDSAYKY